MGILQLLGALRDVIKLRLVLFGLQIPLGRRQRRWDYPGRRGLLSGSSCLRARDRATTASVIVDLECLLDAHHVVKLALIFELANYDVVLLEVVVAKVFHKEECFSHLPVSGICSIPTRGERLLKLVSVSLWLKTDILQRRRLASILLNRLSRRFKRRFGLYCILRS